MLTHSLRWRLQIWLGFLLVCLLTGFCFALHQLQRAHQWNQLDEELERRVAAVSVAVRGGPRPEFGPGGPPFDDGGRRPPHGFPDGPPPEGRRDPKPGPREVRLPSETAGLFEENRADAFYFVVWSREGGLLKRSTHSPSETPMPARMSRDTRIHIRVRETVREAYHFTELGDCILAGRSIASDLVALRLFTLGLLAAGGTVLAFGLGGGWWLTTRAIRPIEQISAAASRISAGNLSERITAAEPRDELGKLASVLNSAFARLESAFAQQKQFTADASHELRTPLAVLISEAQTTLSRARTAGEYRETVEACLATAQQMRRLTESLLELARLDGRDEQAVREVVDLAEAARSALERLRPLAAARGVQLIPDLSPARARANADHLDQVLANLIANAVHYNKPGGEVRVSTRVEEGAVVLAVTDTGVGIAPGDLPHVFERFYRADKSRASAEGRFGLGLAICKAIVDAHRGRIEATSELGRGTTFTVRIPVT
ncbi:MAG: HAMP domain-containing protein [Verrucomicrobia bacterium]|nr:HAMP domain-containing protein [Verrucomicrobiota bacterium]